MSPNNLLTDPIFPTLTDRGERRLTLPGVLAVLAGGDVVAFHGLAAHQRQAWFQFLAQVAAIALHRADLTEPPGDESAWAGLLAALTPEPAETGWSLVVEDATRPAFLQPPIRTGRLNDYRPLADTPDGIDLLITAKNHDLKAARLGAAEPHHWVFALVTLQTLQGFLGAGNYGIARMNGGFASRVLIDYVPESASWGARLRRAVALLLEQRVAILEEKQHYFQPEDGCALLWLEPWDEDKSLSLQELDPYFIEICRRVRLVRDPADGHPTALGRTSGCARVDAAAAKGNLGDPWMPIDVQKGAALTVGAGGFHYRKVTEILYSQKFSVPPAMRARANDPHKAMRTQFAVMVRGQGKTEGLYERFLAARHHRAFEDLHIQKQRELLYVLAEEMIKTNIDAGARRALRAGLCAVMQGGKDDIDFRDRRADAWIDRLDQRIDEIFFDHLSALAGAGAGASEGGASEGGGKDGGGAEERDLCRTAWQRALADMTKALFLEAAELLPTPSARRERARARGESLFYAMLYKSLPMARPARPPAAGWENDATVSDSDPDQSPEFPPDSEPEESAR